MLRFLAHRGHVASHRVCQNTAVSARKGLIMSELVAVGGAVESAPCRSHSRALTAESLLQQAAPLWSLVRSFASDASGSPAGLQAEPIKKGLSAGTVPPATEQVPPGAIQQPSPSAEDSDPSAGAASSAGSRSSVPKSSATVGTDKPSASAIPAGVDQVSPASSTRAAPTQTSKDDTTQQSEPSTSAPSSRQSMQSVLHDIGDAGQLNKQASKIPDATVSRWQRFKWWVWGTPQQYWSTNQDNADLGRKISNSSEAKDDASSTDLGKGAAKWQRSRWSIADIIASAILRSRITKDEDVARFASKSAATAIYTLAGFSLLGTVGVDTKPLVAGLGVGGFTVGFALRDVATNFVSGVLLVLQRPFEKGNRLRVHAGSTVLEGEVQSIELRYIVLKPKDQSLIMIPASIVYANPVVVLKA